ncbi:hypothetical protein VTK26DRAFT_3758 [Humicola hyalothermophila]
MPICIECRHPVKTLWREGGGDKSGGHNIRLTVCKNCGRFCDKYVEHDFVVLFIDLVLIKPQVYRHLLHNTLMKDEDEFSPSIIRLGILLLLFDVYLTWARIERLSAPDADSTIENNFGRLAQQPIVLQYIPPLHALDPRLPRLDPAADVVALVAARPVGGAAALPAAQLGIDGAARLVVDQAVPHPHGHLGVRRARRGAVARVGGRRE